jgi:plastocyanin
MVRPMRREVLVTFTAMLVVAVASQAAYRETLVTDGGTINGHVRVIGGIAPLPPQPVFKEKDYCGETVVDERLVTDPAGGVAGAVVHLVDVAAGKPIARSDTIRLDNRKCAFVPHVASASVGQSLEMHNYDPFLHDAHAWLGSQTLFNLAIPRDRTVRHTLTEPGIAHVNCNIRHTWMHAYLFVADHPYHVVTDASGRFELDQVPPGTYTIAVHALRRQLSVLTTTRLDGRSAVAVQVRLFKGEVVKDLGGDLSRLQETVLESAAQKWLLAKTLADYIGPPTLPGDEEAPPAAGGGEVRPAARLARAHVRAAGAAARAGGRRGSPPVPRAPGRRAAGAAAGAAARAAGGRMTPLTIIDAMSDPQLFGKDFTSRGWRQAVDGVRGRDAAGSWSAWKAFLAVLYGLPVSPTAARGGAGVHGPRGGTRRADPRGVRGLRSPQRQEPNRQPGRRL